MRPSVLWKKRPSYGFWQDPNFSIVSLIKESGINGKSDLPKGMGVSVGLVHKTVKNNHSETLDNSGVNSRKIGVH
jgi:hypothetical protein